MLKLPQVHARTVPLLPAGKDGMVVDGLWPGSGPLDKGASEAALRARSIGSQHSEQVLDVSWTVIQEAAKELGIRVSSVLHQGKQGETTGCDASAIAVIQSLLRHFRMHFWPH